MPGLRPHLRKMPRGARLVMIKIALTALLAGGCAVLGFVASGKLSAALPKPVDQAPQVDPMAIVVQKLEETPKLVTLTVPSTQPIPSSSKGALFGVIPTGETSVTQIVNGRVLIGVEFSKGSVTRVGDRPKVHGQLSILGFEAVNSTVGYSRGFLAPDNAPDLIAIANSEGRRQALMAACKQEYRELARKNAIAFIEELGAIAEIDGLVCPGEQNAQKKEG